MNTTEFTPMRDGRVLVRDILDNGKTFRHYLDGPEADAWLDAHGQGATLMGLERDLEEMSRLKQDRRAIADDVMNPNRTERIAEIERQLLLLKDLIFIATAGCDDPDEQDET